MFDAQNNTDISHLIPKDSISIDGQKLHGIDEFIVDERRANVTIKLLNRNKEENDTIKNILTDKNNLLSDNMETEEISSIVFSHDKALAAFDRNRLFYLKTVQHTYERGNGELALESLVLRNIIYNTCENPMAGGQDGDGESFFNNFTAMLCAIILNFSGQNLNVDLLTAARIYEFIEARTGILDAEYDSDKLTLSLAIYNFISQMVGNRETAYHKIDDFYNDVSSLIGTNKMLHHIFYVNETEQDTAYVYNTDMYYDMNTNTNIDHKAWLISDLFASLILEEDYNQLVQGYTYNGMNPQNIERVYVSGYYTSTGYYVIHGAAPTPCSPFYQNKNVVLGGTLSYHSYIPVDYHNNRPSKSSTFLMTLNIRNINVCSQIQSNGLKIGKMQLKTPDNSSEGNIEIITEDTENQQYWNDYIPVERTYRFVSGCRYFNRIDDTSYSMYLDNIKINELLSDSNTFLYTTGFTETNWMYADAIRCTERVLDKDEDIKTDYIPIYIPNNPLYEDINGDFIYAGHCERFYTKEPSNIMNIVTTIKDENNNIIFNGLVDYNSIVINKTEIEFSAVDAIGLLYENAKKLSDIVRFAQFGIDATNIVPDLRTGNTLQEFINTIIGHPFPINHDLNTVEFNIGVNNGLSNKLLTQIDAEKAISLAIKCSMKLIMTDNYGKIQLVSLNSGDTKIIDGDIISVTENQSLELNKSDMSDIENISDYKKIITNIKAFQNKLSRQGSTQLSIKIYNQKSNLNILDKIIYNNKTYIIIEKSIDIFNNFTTITLVSEK